MSDNYTLFSETLEIEGSEEQQKRQHAWLTHQLMTVEGHWKSEELGERVFFDEDDVPVEYAGLDYCYLGPRFLSDWEDLDEQEPCQGFQIDNVAGGLCFFAVDNGEPSKLAWLIQKFLKEFDDQARWTMQFAHTCDRPRPEEFGGGAVLVTAEQQYWFNTYCALCDALRAVGPWAGKKMMEVEYWRCWPGNQGDSGVWDTDYIEIPHDTPEDQYDAMVRVAVSRIPTDNWQDGNRPCFVGFYAEAPPMEDEDDEELDGSGTA